MLEPDYIRAHKHSTEHSAELLASKTCACFHCRQTFPPSFVTHWVDKDDEGIGQTALCPHCGTAAVLGSACGFPLTLELLGAMHQHWF